MIETNFGNVAARRRVAPVLAEMNRALRRSTLAERLLEEAVKEILEDPERVRSPLVRDSRGVHAHLFIPVYECIVSSQWSIYYTTDTDTRRHLVTSDDPVLRLPADITDDFGPLPQGELDGFLMPLSPKRLLVCRRRSGRLVERLTEPVVEHPDADMVIRHYCLTNDQIEHTNLLMASTAWKHVFATRPVRKIERWDSEDIANPATLLPLVRPSGRKGRFERGAGSVG